MIDSPCNSICTLDHKTKLCKGCGRTVEEIVGWISYTEQEKKQVLDSLKSR